MRITKSFVDSVPSPVPAEGTKQAQQFYRDSAIPGFGLRVMNSGAKSFIVEKRINGKVRRMTLGKYGNLTVEQARKEAMQILGKVASGVDPIAEKKTEQAKAQTLQAIFEDYLIARKDLKPNTVRDYQRCMTWGFNDWLSRPITEISKGMVELRHRKLGQSSHARANNALRVLRALFNHARYKLEDAEGNPLIVVNPVDRLSQTRSWFKVKRRRTLLKPHQLKPWYEATLQLNAETTRDYLHFLLFTGLRRSEASRLEWAHIDFEDRTFTIPDTKNGLDHTLPLSSFLESLLKRRFEARESIFVFPSHSQRGYLNEPKGAITRVSELCDIDFTLHDLRRTFITIAESLDIPAYALKRLMNHKDANDVTAGYIISDIERLRLPMQQVSSFILNHINDVPLPQESPNEAQANHLIKLVS